MIKILIWERFVPDRITSLKTIIRKTFNSKLHFIEDSKSSSYNGLEKNISNSTRVLFAHTSNLADKNHMLNIIKKIYSSYKNLIIILYTGGKININNDGDLMIDEIVYDFDLSSHPNIDSISLSGYEPDKHFAKSLNLEKAFQVLLKTNDPLLFFDEIHQRDQKKEKQLLSFHSSLTLENKALFNSLDEITDKKLLIVYHSTNEEKNVTFKNHTLVHNQLEFEKIVSNRTELNSHDSVLIIPELFWETNPKTRGLDFLGLELASDLRKKNRYLGSILFISKFNLTDFIEFERKKQGDSFRILYGSGSSLLQLKKSESPNKFMSRLKDVYSHLKPLSPAALIDINTMLLNKLGNFIDSATHSLNFEKDEQTIISLLDKSVDVLSNTENDQLKSIKEKISDAKKKDDRLLFDRYRDLFIRSLENKLGRTDKADSLFLEITKSNSSILILEDDQKTREFLEKTLSKYFDVIVFDKSQDALAYLKTDVNYNINCIIADWRLYTNQENKVWQPLQGYDFLDKVSRFHFASLASLTSESDPNVHEIRNLLGLNITLFKKQHLPFSDGEDNSWRLFADAIKDLCRRSREQISSLPTGDAWTKETKKNKFNSWENKYLEIRSSNWKVFEQTISSKSNLCWEYYNQALDSENWYNLQAFDRKFGLQIGYGNIDNLLIIRRLWLALWFNKGRIDFMPATGSEEVPVISIYLILKGIDREEFGYDYADHKIHEWNNKSTVFLNSLCIKADLLPQAGILPEEKAWLTKNGIDISQNSTEFNDYDE